MLEPEVPADEEERLLDLCRTRMLDTRAEERFDRITRLARHLFHVPIALISLVDRDRQWFKSRQGLDACETPRRISFCGHAILSDDLFVVSDAPRDARFADNPLVLGPPEIRFYAGAPLHASSGRRLGTLCIIDRVPRTLSGAENAALRDLAALAEEEISNIALAESMLALENEVRRRSHFVSLIAHEVRTPLTSIRAAIGLLRAGSQANGGRAREVLDIADRNAHRLGEVLGQFLQIERLEAEAAPVNLRIQPLLPVLQDALDASVPVAASRNVHLRLIPTGETIHVNVDAARLCNVLSHVLSNAIRYSHEGGVVELSMQAHAGRARLLIEDFGTGIPDSYKARLFQPFSQADEADARAQGGAGLGLAISKGLLERMGAAIAIASTFGKGTEVTIDLPLCPDAGAASEAQADRVPS